MKEYWYMFSIEVFFAFKILIIEIDINNCQIINLNQYIKFKSMVNNIILVMGIKAIPVIELSTWNWNKYNQLLKTFELHQYP